MVARGTPLAGPMQNGVYLKVLQHYFDGGAGNQIKLRSKYIFALTTSNTAGKRHGQGGHLIAVLHQFNGSNYGEQAVLFYNHLSGAMTIMDDCDTKVSYENIDEANNAQTIVGSIDSKTSSTTIATSFGRALL